MNVLFIFLCSVLKTPIQPLLELLRSYLPVLASIPHLTSLVIPLSELVRIYLIDLRPRIVSLVILAEQRKKKYKRKGQRKEVLFKDDEWEVVKHNAQRMNLSTTRYIVKMSLSGYSVPQEIFGFAELTRQLSRIGTNINQLARKANTINNIYAED